MGSYSVFILDGAVEELRATPFPFRRQINQRLMKLREEPVPEAAELVIEDRYRLKVSDWWILYEVDEAGATVTIVAIIRAGSP